MEMSQNDPVEDKFLNGLLQEARLAQYFKRLLSRLDLVEFINSQQESIMPTDRKQMLSTILLSIGVVEAPPRANQAADSAPAAQNKESEAIDKVVKQLAEVFPHLSADQIGAAVREAKGDLDQAALALAGVVAEAPTPGKGEEGKAAGAKETKDGEVMVSVGGNGKGKDQDKPAEETNVVKEDLLSLLRGDSEQKAYREEISEEQKTRELRQKEIMDEHKRAMAQAEDEQLDLREAAIRKTKELAAKYMYDDDDDELPILVAQDSTAAKNPEVTEDGEDGKEEQKPAAQGQKKEKERRPEPARGGRREEKKEEVKEVKKEMTQQEKEYAKKKKQIDKEKRKFNKSKRGGAGGGQIAYRKKG